MSIRHSRRIERAAFASLLGMVAAGAAQVRAQEGAQAALPQEQIVATEIPDIELTPELLAEALSCHSTEVQRAFRAQANFKDLPDWITPDTAVYASYKLARSVDFLGIKVDRIVLAGSYILAELPREAGLAQVREQKLERVPIRIMEEYVGFLDEAQGPMIIVSEPPETAATNLKAIANGAANRSVSPSLYVGCDYEVGSRKQFLDLAAWSDAEFDKMVEAFRPRPGSEMTPKAGQ